MSVWQDDPRWTALLAGLPSIGAAVWTAWKWWGGRLDKRDEREDRRERELDQQQMAWMVELRRENTALREELIATRKDRDRGWSLARYWHGAAQDLARAMRNLRHDLENLRQWIKFAVMRHDDLPEPDMPPLPERVVVPFHLEDPKES